MNHDSARPTYTLSEFHNLRTVTDPERTPERPTGVRIVFRNGASIDCDVKYLGRRRWPHDVGGLCDGWRVLNEGPFDYREGDKLEIDYMPPKTYVECPGTGPIQEGSGNRG